MLVYWRVLSLYELVGEEEFFLLKKPERFEFVNAT